MNLTAQPIEFAFHLVFENLLPQSRLDQLMHLIDRNLIFIPLLSHVGGRPDRQRRAPFPFFHQENFRGNFVAELALIILVHQSAMPPRGTLRSAASFLKSPSD